MKTNTHNNFFSYLIVLLVFFILIFFTKDIYWKIQEQRDILETQAQEIVSQKDKLGRLKKLQQDLSVEESSIDTEIRWFSWDFSDENIMNHIYAYAQEVNLGKERIIIRDMSLSSWEQSDTWFMKADVNVNIITSSEETLFAFLNFLTDEDSDFRFYISSFQYDLWAVNGNIGVSIPLTFYYK